MAKSNSPRVGGEAEDTSAQQQEQEQEQEERTAAAPLAQAPATGATGTASTTTDTERPVRARVPYPHAAMRLPGGGAAPTEGHGERADLVITREWTDVPGDQVQRLKDTARRGRVKLKLAIPNENTGE